MFIAQVMYAEGLKKVLLAILSVRREAGLLCKLDKLKEAEQILDGIPGCGTLSALREEIEQTQRQISPPLAESLALLQRCGIEPAEYEQKFMLVSSDCLRISHGSVKPPQWQAA